MPKQAAAKTDVVINQKQKNITISYTENVMLINHYKVAEINR